jgi:hypothetical protein
MPVLALTDHNNLYGAVPFYIHAQKEGIKPVQASDRHGKVDPVAGGVSGPSGLDGLSGLGAGKPSGLVLRALCGPCSYRTAMLGAWWFFRVGVPAW